VPQTPASETDGPRAGTPGDSPGSPGMAPGPQADPPFRGSDWLLSALRDLAWSLWPVLLPLLPGLALVVAAYVTSGWLQQRELHSIQRGVEAEAGLVARDFELALERRVRVVEAAARATSRMPRTASAEDWRLLVQPLVFQDYQFRAMLWLDRTLAARQVAPPSERLFPSLYPEDDDLRRVALQGVILGPSRDPSTGFVTSSLALPSGERELLVAAPVGDSLRSDYVAAVIRVRDLIDAVSTGSVRRGYSVSVYEGPYLLFGPRWEQGGPPAQYAREAEVRSGGVAWRVQVWPDETLTARLESPASRLVLWLGVALALLTSLIIYLARTPAE
jgi:sensor domain CHASE-containing protein